MSLRARRNARLPVVGLMGESVLGTLAGLQFAATLHSPLPAELTWYLAMTEQITTITPKIVDGAMDLPDGASLAALIDWSRRAAPGHVRSATTMKLGLYTFGELTPHWRDGKAISADQRL